MTLYLVALIILIPIHTYAIRTLNPSDAHAIFEASYEKIWNAGFLISEDEAAEINQQKSTSLYGEITWDSAVQIFNDLKLTKKDVFFELGCGTGKVCAQAYLTSPFKKIVGIELAPTRLAYALDAQSSIIKQARTKKLKKKKWEYRHANLLDADLHDATVIYTLTMFENEVMQELTNKLAQLKNGLRVISFKQLTEHPHFTLVKTYRLPTSWNKHGAPIYLYKLDKRRPIKPLPNILN